MARRIVVTGMGVVSPLGNDADSVAASLREGRSGLRAMPEYAEMGLRSQVAGVAEIDLEAVIDQCSSSPPPASTMSWVPWRIMSAAAPMQCAEVAQAADSE